ncbi:hypothetical protein E2C01_096974 [Portunus trituberculatus]|uniref:Uncharacterized protein n=1 Tax=Portunus trituberculatus TaxID=210409 RepID=A0A5B7K4H9_PORTR|nr:hypothetical protein [Portunus trituberculatus]
MPMPLEITHLKRHDAQELL